MRSMMTFALLLLTMIPPPATDPAAPSQQQASGAPSADAFHAPDIFDLDDPAIERPRLIKEVKPNYTFAAMQRKIQGPVVMEAVVERDGSIGAVRILHSLDPQYGLDSEAVRTVGQWRFAAATKNGESVRARIVIEMAFTMGGPAVTADLHWPPGFPEPHGNLKNAAAGFTRKTLAAVGLRISVAYPPDWNATRTATADDLITISKRDERAVRSLAIFSSGKITADISTPLSKKGLAEVEKFVKDQVRGNRDTQLLKVGQVWTYDRQWIWAATRHRGVDASEHSPDEAAAMLKRFSETRVWTFTTTERAHDVRVVCTVYVPANLSKDALNDYLHELVGDFQVILDRMSIVVQ